MDHLKVGPSSYTIPMVRLMKSMEKVLKQNNTMDIEEVRVGGGPGLGLLPRPGRGGPGAGPRGEDPRQVGRGRLGHHCILR